MLICKWRGNEWWAESPIFIELLVNAAGCQIYSALGIAEWRPHFAFFNPNMITVYLTRHYVELIWNHINVHELYFWIAACSNFEFRCRSGDCVAIYDRCNGISQCDDGSDEDPSECGGQLSKKGPIWLRQLCGTQWHWLGYHIIATVTLPLP